MEKNHFSPEDFFFFFFTKVQDKETPTILLEISGKKNQWELRKSERNQ